MCADQTAIYSAFYMASALLMPGELLLAHWRLNGWKNKHKISGLA
jgi:hypothetical protein